MIAIDTNLLVYAHRAGLPKHDRAKQAIEKACAGGQGWAIPAPCVAEFWAVVTHPSCAGGPSRAEQARAFLGELTKAGATVLDPRDGFVERLLRLAGALKVQGPRIFDLQIALVSLEGGATEIWTHDRQFVSLRGLRVKDPL